MIAAGLVGQVTEEGGQFAFKLVQSLVSAPPLDRARILESFPAYRRPFGIYQSRGLEALDAMVNGHRPTALAQPADQSAHAKLGGERRG